MQNTIRGLIQKNGSKIILLVMDGVGGLPLNGKTELETASTPNLDKLASESACGQHIPVGHGITPGSGPGHLGLFGYDPLEWEIGRGILEAMGLGLEVKRTDIAVRCNYATIENGIIKDRRAGRPATEKTAELTKLLSREIQEIDGVKFIFGAGMEHRFAIVMRFPEALTGEAAKVNDSDPQHEGRAPLPFLPGGKKAEKVAAISEKFIRRATEILKDHSPANFVLMRGFSTHPHMPSFEEVYGLRSLAVASYPMYRGISRLLDMEAPDMEGGFDKQIEYLEARYKDFDYFFLHFKKTDSMGEDGNFAGKVKKIEEADSFMPRLLALKPDVLIITGDHSTPAVMKGHSWHPVPFLMKAPYVLGRTCARFTERECLKGEIGTIKTDAIMSLALAQAGRLKKFGA